MTPALPPCTARSAIRHCRGFGFALGAGFLLLVASQRVLAHRLDECLQATRIALATHRVELSIDLTPGATVADRMWDMIDEDQNGDLTDDERAGYVQRVLQETRIRLDGAALAPQVADASFPTREEFRRGQGVIRIKAAATVGPLAAGAHRLTLTNAHLPTLSVFLVNALVPKDETITILRQSRDELQKGYQLDFRIAPAPR